MHLGVKVFDIMIASPGDVVKERMAIVDAIRKWNSIHLEKDNVMLRPLSWEVDCPRGTSNDSQSLIDETMLAKCDMLVAVFWKTLGRKDPRNKDTTYTVGEIKKHILSGKPAIIFFKNAKESGNNADETRRIAKVQRFKETIASQLGKECIYADFNDLSDFQIDSRLETDVYYHLLRIKMPIADELESSMRKPFTIVSQHHKLEYVDSITYKFEKVIKVRANYNGIRQYTDVFQWNASGILDYHAFKGNGQECRIWENYESAEGWRHYVFSLGNATVANKEYIFKIQRNISKADFRCNQYVMAIASDDDIDLCLELKVPNMSFASDIRRNRYRFAEESTAYESEELKLDENCCTIFKPMNVKKHEKYAIEWTIEK